MLCRAGAGFTVHHKYCTNFSSKFSRLQHQAWAIVVETLHRKQLVFHSNASDKTDHYTGQRPDLLRYKLMGQASTVPFDYPAILTLWTQSVSPSEQKAKICNKIRDTYHETKQTVKTYSGDIV
jgi:hypothetical protein